MPIDSIRSALFFRAAKRCRRARSAKGLAQLTTSLAAFISNSRREALEFTRPQSSQQIGAWVLQKERRVYRKKCKAMRGHEGQPQAAR